MSGLNKNRIRNQTVCFRVSPEERRQIEARIAVSGMQKGEYYIQSLLHQQINIVVGKYQSDRLSLELRRLREQIEGLNDKEKDQVEPLLDECRALLSEFQEITAKNTRIEEFKKTDFGTRK